MKSTSKVVCWVIVLLVVAGIVTGVVMVRKNKEKQKQNVQTVEIVASKGTIKSRISTTGSVAPQNRLELKPPIGGRLEELLVKEGDSVKAGQIIGWLSSTERAALLDAARAQGDKELAYWRDVYKPTPVIAPIDGEVIVRKIEPGQTVGADTPIVVLSDRLIVQANVDETDIGKVEEGQTAEVKLDAYPDVKAAGKVDHVSYESRVVNNVTIYEVDIACDKVPDVFRSGMSAEVKILSGSKDDILLVPDEAITHEKGTSFVYISDGKSKEGTKQKIDTGLSDETNVEVVGGLKEGDKILYKKQVFSISDMKAPEANPFLPSRPGAGRRRQ
jgi:membrane fusion protein, macrolide-specific efflux system